MLYSIFILVPTVKKDKKLNNKSDKNASDKASRDNKVDESRATFNDSNTIITSINIADTSALPVTRQHILNTNTNQIMDSSQSSGARNLTASTAKPKSASKQSREDEQLSLLSDKENNNKHDDELDKAATKIQSTFRGYKTRKNLSKAKDDEKISSNSTGKSSRVVKKRSNTSSNLPSGDHTMADKSKRLALINDPEVAAIKIQSTFRGYKTRKQLESQTNKFPKTKSGHEINEGKSLSTPHIELSGAGEPEKPNTNTNNK